MGFDYSGKSVLITGASSGIGAGIARELASRGAMLTLVARRRDRLESLADEIRRSGGRVLALEGDVDRDGDLERAVRATVDEFGRLDGAIANAGYASVGKVASLTMDDFRRQFETNVFGVLRTLYASLPELERTQGFLALVGSVNGHVSVPGAAPYCMSKFAVRSLAESFSHEAIRRGVSVTLISPGFVASEIRGDRVRVPEWLVMKTDVASRQIVRAIARRDREAIITGHGKLAVFLQRHFPWLVSFAMRFARF